MISERKLKRWRSGVSTTCLLRRVASANAPKWSRRTDDSRTIRQAASEGAQLWPCVLPPDVRYSRADSGTLVAPDSFETPPQIPNRAESTPPQGSEMASAPGVAISPNSTTRARPFRSVMSLLAGSLGPNLTFATRISFLTSKFSEGLQLTDSCFLLLISPPHRAWRHYH